MAEQIAVLLLALVFPGAGGTIAELFLLLTDLADDMRGSKAMCMQVVKRVEFLYQHVESIQSTRVLEHNDVLPKLATTITSFLDLMKRHSRKHSFARYLARHDVAADIAAFHSDLDAISLALNLTTAAEIAELRGEFKENQKKDAKVSCEILSNTRALMDEYRGRGLREVIHDMQFAIQKSSDPAKSGSARLFADDIKLMQRTMDAMVKQYGVQLGVLPPWYVPSDEVCCLEEHFATGTYGSVHRATWKGTRVVVKKLLVPVDESIERDFQREMTIWHEVNNHPHIIELYGGCHVATPPFFVCADATGGNFADHFRDPDNKRRFLWRRFHEAALGLTHLHTEKKVVHGDLKCCNLLVGADGKTKICDFGFSFIRRESRAISVKAQTDAVRWKALECAMGEEHTPQNPQFKSDVYSLGMCIIEAVSGSEPWTGLSDEEIFDNLESGKRHARPDGFTDKQWQLVEAMTAIDVMARMSLDKALAMLERLADDEEALYPSTLVCPTCRVESPGKSKFCSECAHSFIDSNARAAAAS